MVRAPVATTVMFRPPTVALPWRAKQSPFGRQFLSEVGGSGAHLVPGSFSMPSQSDGETHAQVCLGDAGELVCWRGTGPGPGQERDGGKGRGGDAERCDAHDGHTW